MTLFTVSSEKNSSKFSYVTETLDLSRDRNLPDTSLSFVIVLARWTRWTVRILRSHRYPARWFHHARSSICSSSTRLRVKQDRRNERRRDERRENDEKWTVDEDSFSTDTLPAFRACESADEKSSRFVSRPFYTVSPSLLLSPPSRRFFCYFIRIHGKDIRCRPSRRARETPDNRIIDRRVSTGMIAPFDDSPSCQWRNIRIRSDIHT